MGLSRRRVSAIEAAAAPSPRDVERYLRELERIDAGGSSVAANAGDSRETVADVVDAIAPRATSNFSQED